jgi:hypothetical protein
VLALGGLICRRLPRTGEDYDGLAVPSGEVEMITQDIALLRSENAELRRLLEKHQWSGLTPRASGGVCPECCASVRTGDGHRPDCAIGVVLAASD